MDWPGSFSREGQIHLGQLRRSSTLTDNMVPNGALTATSPDNMVLNGALMGTGGSGGTITDGGTSAPSTFGDTSEYLPSPTARPLVL